jgi:hypothetical protein
MAGPGAPIEANESPRDKKIPSAKDRQAALYIKEIII